MSKEIVLVYSCNIAYLSYFNYRKLRIQSEEGPRLETSNGQRTSVLQDGKAARNIALTNGEQQKPKDLDVMGSSMQDDKDAATAESTEETSKPRDASTAVGVESDEQVTSNQTGSY